MSEETILERLARIEEKQDAQIALLNRIERAESDQEQRIRTLERRDAYVLGVGAVIALAWPFIAKKLFGL